MADPSKEQPHSQIMEIKQMVEEVSELHVREILHENSGNPHTQMIQHGDTDGEVLQEYELLKLEEKIS